jgi:hypothetical protein
MIQNKASTQKAWHDTFTNEFTANPYLDRASNFFITEQSLYILNTKASML